MSKKHNREHNGNISQKEMVRLEAISGQIEALNCVARTVQCKDNQGHKNFRILSLKIENGVVTDITYSDHYANFDCMDRLEKMDYEACLNLNMGWEQDKCWKQ